MKRFFTVFLAAMAVVLCVVSCNKVDKVAVGDLNGSVWTASGNIPDGPAAVATVTFGESTFELVVAMGGASMTMTGTYTYSFPDINVTLTFEGEKQSAVVVMSPDFQTATLTIEDVEIVFTRLK